jgi:hypothetical protein
MLFFLFCYKPHWDISNHISIAMYFGIVGKPLIWKGALKQFIMFRPMMQELFNIE